MKTGGDIIITAINEKGLEAVRKIVYTTALSEVEAMRLFIESRQDWCKESIYKNLKEVKEL